MRLAWISVLALTSVGCKFDLPSAFNCKVDSQCNAGAGGRCEPNSFCSYADSDCASGQRYGNSSGGNSGVCVGEDPFPDGGTPDSPGASFCYGSTGGLARPCFFTPPTGDISLTTAIDTTTDPRCSTIVTDAAGLCVIAGANITVPGGTVGVSGNKPLVLVATGTITISGVLDAASHHELTIPYATTQVGAGADPMNGCNTPGPPGASGGGAGGTFTELGGAGGGGNAGSAGGTAATQQVNVTLRGGCSGQSALNSGGRGGHGGGAVYLIASSINIDGTINASGEGGNFGASGGKRGGGGGGSGGLIGLDAGTITNTGLVFANGGGGGEGSTLSSSGNPGADPIGAGIATGGAGGSAGGNGGAGGAGGTAGGTKPGGNGTAAANDGGGGGGGSTGVIKVFGGGTLNGQYSPNPS